MVSHGFLRWAIRGGGRRQAICECSWASSTGWRKSNTDHERQVEELRQHVRSHWDG